MIITFKRFGHANNSSSSHSIIYAPNLTVQDERNPFWYQWDCFTLSSRYAKEEYLITQYLMNQTLPHSWDDSKNAEMNYQLSRHRNILKHHLKHYVFQSLDVIFDHLISDNNIEFSVDHQSIITFPVDDAENTNLDFFFDFCHEILSNDFIILGGNDNDGEHGLSDSGSKTQKQDFVTLYDSILEQGRGSVKAVKDKTTKEWVLTNNAKYSRYAGTVMKIIFGIDVPKEVEINMNDPKIFFSDVKTNFFKKSGFPYLVDLKINSYCNYGCEFCYTSSTNEGDHADVNLITQHILPALKNANVIEVVLGGGEPTTHPNLLEIVKCAKELKMKVGITTKNYKLQNHPRIDEVLRYVDSVAISVNNSHELAKAIKVVAPLRTATHWYMQTILGLVDWQTSKELFEAAQDTFKNITFLGYKNFGFGKNVNSVLVDKNWYHDLKNLSRKYNVNVGIDSLIANKYRDELIASHVDWNYLVGSEGKASCYIDAMQSTIAPSSFTTENIIPFDFASEKSNDSTEFLKVFASF